MVWTLYQASPPWDRDRDGTRRWLKKNPSGTKPPKIFGSLWEWGWINNLSRGRDQNNQSPRCGSQSYRSWPCSPLWSWGCHPAGTKDCSVGDHHSPPPCGASPSQKWREGLSRHPLPSLMYFLGTPLREQQDFVFSKEETFGPVFW